MRTLTNMANITDNSGNVPIVIYSNTVLTTIRPPTVTAEDFVINSFASATKVAAIAAVTAVNVVIAVTAAMIATMFTVNI